MYYITDYYTGDIIDVTTDLQRAINISKRHEDSQVEDEFDNVFFTNIDLPF